MMRPALLLAAALVAAPASATPFEDATRGLAARPITQLDWLVLNAGTWMRRLFETPGPSNDDFAAALRQTKAAVGPPVATARMEADGMLLTVLVVWTSLPTPAECIGVLTRVRNDLLEAGKWEASIDLDNDAGRTMAAGRLMAEVANPPSSRTPRAPDALGATLAASTTVAVGLLGSAGRNTGVRYEGCRGSLGGKDYRPENR